MRLNLSQIFFAIRTNFWLIPGLLGLAGITCALLLLEADFALRQSSFMAFLAMPIESARLALSTIAGSMITMASLVFSMTLVALTLVSQQLGPRILVRFMDDRPTQIILGLFIATFLFSLILLIRSGQDASDGRVPGVAVAVSALLAVVALGAMIHFIDHMATRIQADVIVGELGRDLELAASRFIERGSGEQSFACEEEWERLDRMFESSEVIGVKIHDSGYLRRPDAPSIAKLAAEHGLVIRLDLHPGDFALGGLPVLSVVDDGQSGDKDRPAEEDLAEKLRAFIWVGRRRTPEASIEYEIDALVEVAIRALSPGINDSFTAMTCIDRLSEGLRTLMQRNGDRRVERDAEDVIRFAHAPEPFRRYLGKAFGPIRHNAHGNPLVLAKLAEAIDRLEQTAHTDDQLRSLNEFARSLDRLRDALPDN